MGAHINAMLSAEGTLTDIPWVDEMERADAAVGPWSVHLLEIAPKMTDADVAKLQEMRTTSLGP